MIIECTLDQHLLTNVSNFLGAQSLSTASQVNHVWQELATNNKPWKSLNRSHWPDLCKKINTSHKRKSFYNKLKKCKASTL